MITDGACPDSKESITAKNAGPLPTNLNGPSQKVQTETAGAPHAGCIKAPNCGPMRARRHLPAQRLHITCICPHPTFTLIVPPFEYSNHTITMQWCIEYR